MSTQFPKGFRREGSYKSLGISEMLPADVKHELQAATRAEPDYRIMAIDRAVSRAKRKYPQLFKE